MVTILLIRYVLCKALKSHCTDATNCELILPSELYTTVVTADMRTTTHPPYCPLCSCVSSKYVRHPGERLLIVKQQQNTPLPSVLLQKFLPQTCGAFQFPEVLPQMERCTNADTGLPPGLIIAFLLKCIFLCPFPLMLLVCHYPISAL